MPQSGATSSDEISWSFTPNGNDLNFITEGETVILPETVTVADNGEFDTATVTVTISGATQGKLTLTPSAQSGSVNLTENASGSITNGPQTGSIQFTDTDPTTTPAEQFKARPSPQLTHTETRFSSTRHKSPP